MSEFRGESINFNDQKIVIRREPIHELYLAFEPPNASPYMVAPLDTKPEDLVAFVEYWQNSIHEIQSDMIGRFEKSKSLKCHYRTGDVAYLFGRPFMLRVYPSASKKRIKDARVRSNVKATIRTEISVIELYLLQVGNYDQGKSAFLSFAKPIFAQNVVNLVQQSMERTLPDEKVPRTVKTRPMRDSWVHIDDKKDVVWFSEDLIPYPPDFVVYAFLVELLKQRRPEASEEEIAALLDKGVTRWREIKEVFADPNNPYTNQ